MSKYTLLNYKADFASAEVASTGGVTGSGKVTSKLTGKSYQLKKSIQDASLKRRRADSGLDHENFGEVISARIARALTESDVAGKPQEAPKVLLVKGEKGKVMVASEYLEGVQGTLDDYAEKAENIKRKE